MVALSSQADVLVIGAGAMGSGIAQVAAAAGHRVGVYDVFPDAVDRALTKISNDLNRLVERKKLEPEDRDRLLSRLCKVTQLEDFPTARLAIEAVREDIDIKRTLFAKLEDILAADAVLASNTSSLSITAIGAELRRPERFAGMHFFNPAPVMALVEVVQGLATSDETVQLLCATAEEWGKKPVRASSTPGFIVNRVARPFYGEGLRALQEGTAEPALLDTLMRDCAGFRMGPFELMDLIGHDVNFAVTSSVHAAYFGDPRYTPSHIQRELVEAGRLGRKSGRGFYRYGPTAAPPTVQASPSGPVPRQIHAYGDIGPATPLLESFEKTGIKINRSPGSGYLRVDGIALALTDGRSATTRAVAMGCPDVALFDLALNWSTAPSIAIAVADQARQSTASIAAGVFQALGKAVYQLDDVPGMLVLRTMAMLANEAADAVYHGVANAAAVDTAMKAGANYPIGPLAWADEFGPANVLIVLDSLSATYQDGRYRPSALLRRVAASGGRFHRDAS